MPGSYPPQLFRNRSFSEKLSVANSSKNMDLLFKTIHIHGPLSQTREPPRPGTEGPQGPLIPQQAQGTGSQFLKSPPSTHLLYVCDVRGN